MKQARNSLMAAPVKLQGCHPSSLEIKNHCGRRSEFLAPQRTVKYRPSFAWHRSLGCIAWDTPSSSRRSFDEFERSVDWLHGLAPWSTAATFTFKRESRYGRSTNRSAVLGAVKHFLRLLSSFCFGLKNVKRGQYVPSAVIADMGRYGLHPHVHVSLARPAFISARAFKRHILMAARKTALFDRSRRIRRYEDKGWSRYLLNHGVDNLVDSLLRIPAYQSKKSA